MQRIFLDVLILAFSSAPSPIIKLVVELKTGFPYSLNERVPGIWLLDVAGAYTHVGY